MSDDLTKKILPHAHKFTWVHLGRWVYLVETAALGYVRREYVGAKIIAPAHELSIDGASMYQAMLSGEGFVKDNSTYADVLTNGADPGRKYGTVITRIDYENG